MNEIFSCDCCKRILAIEKIISSNLNCTSCGHGTLKRINPKNYCYQCNRPIYANVSKERNVLCDRCTRLSILKLGDTPTHENLKKYRKSKGYSIRTMANLTGVSIRQYHRMESGDNLLNKKTLALLKENDN